MKLALKKFPNEDSYKKYNILTFCLDSIGDAENGYNFFPLAEMIVEARRDLINKTDLKGKYPLDYVGEKKNEELKKILVAHGCTSKNKTANEKFIGLLKGFMGGSKEVEAGRTIINSMESIYTSLNINSKKICDLIEDMPDELRLKIEKNLLLAKETLNFIGIEKNINLFEEGLIIEKNAGKFTLRALENYKRIGDLPNNGEHLENLNKQINLISEQIANIHQGVIKTINKDVERQALINEEIIKKINVVGP